LGNLVAQTPRERGATMSKSDFVQTVAKKAKVSRAEARRWVEAVFGAM
jgi:nucleoid DNA-binding protein